MRVALALAAVLMTAAAPAAKDAGKEVGGGMIPIAPENLLVIQTTKGRVLVELRPDVAPGHVARIRLLARKGYYDDNVFYRVFPDYLAQTGQKRVGGDSASGEGTLKAEFTFTPAVAPTPVGERAAFLGTLPVGLTSDGRGFVRFCPGVAAMAHYDDPDSGDSQIFFTTGDASALEKQFTAWGRVVSGLEALKSVAPGEPPAAPDRMLSVRVAADLPEAERPRVRYAAPDSAPFKAAVAKLKKEKGDIRPCDLQVPVEVTG